MLGIDAAAPEGDVLAELAFELDGVHLSGGALDGVEDIETGVDEVGDELEDGAAGVDEGFPVGVFVDEVVDLFMEGFVEVAVGFEGDEGTALGAEIGAGDEGGVDAVTEEVEEFLDVVEGDFALYFEYFADVVLAGEGGDVPLLDVADSFWVFHPGGGDEGDVAEGGAGHGEDDGGVGGGEAVNGALVVGEVGVGEWGELFGVFGGVEGVVVDGVLSDDGVEEVSAFGHSAGGWDGGVAFGVDEEIAIGVGGGVEVFGDEDLSAIEEGEGLEVLVFEAEEVFAWGDADDVDAEGEAELVVDLAEHLVGFDDLDEVVGVAEDCVA